MIRFTFTLTFLIFYSALLFAQSITYVTESGNGTQDGSSWINAKPGSKLREVLRTTPEHEHVWIAKGTYNPHATSRDSSFYIASNIRVYGGFSGTETTIAERDWVTNTTILSGDIGIVNDTADNSLHVVYILNAGDSTRLDGLTITMGNANGQYMDPVQNSIGGGVLNFANSNPGLSGISNPRFYNCTFLKNYAFEYGGGYCDYNFGTSKPYFYNCLFDGNASNNCGGAYSVHLSVANDAWPVFDSTRFLNNIMDTTSAPLNSSGGAVYLAKYGTSADFETNATFKNCWFENNGAREGGVIASGRGFKVIIDKCTFRKNFSRSVSVITASNLSYDIKNSTIDSNYSNGSTFSFNTSLANYTAVHTKKYLTNCTISNNTSNVCIFNRTSTSVPGETPTDTTYFTNCLFFNNQVATFRADPDAITTTFLNNCTFYNDESHIYQMAYDRTVLNIASNSQGAFGPGKSTMFINNSIVWYPLGLIGDRSIKTRNDGSSAGTPGIVNTTIKNTIFRSNAGTWPAETGTDGGGNMINEDPLFVDTLGNFRLNCGSPALNSGANSLYPTAIPLADLEGGARIYNTTIDIGAYEQQAIAIVITPDITIDGNNVTIDIGANYTIENATWSMGDGATGSGTSVSHTYSTTGIYNVCLTVQTACGEKDTCFDINLSTSSIINEQQNIQVVTLSPNPATDRIRIAAASSHFPLTIYLRDLNGRIIKEQHVKNSNESFSISDLPPGLYLWQAYNKYSIVAQNKFSKL